MRDFIQIFITGGTFDKEYDYITGSLYFKDTHLHDMLRRGRSKLKVDIKTLMMVDSLEITDTDRELMLANCKRSPAERIILTHGTDTMTETAEYLAKCDLKDKVVVLTGAMIPYAFGSSSDGFFNIGAALAFVQTLDHGVYICMNGMYFHWNEVRKNRDTGFFEHL